MGQLRSYKVSVSFELEVRTDEQHEKVIEEALGKISETLGSRNTPEGSEKFKRILDNYSVYKAD